MKRISLDKVVAASLKRRKKAQEFNIGGIVDNIVEDVSDYILDDLDGKTVYSKEALWESSYMQLDAAIFSDLANYIVKGVAAALKRNGVIFK